MSLHVSIASSRLWVLSNLAQKLRAAKLVSPRGMFGIQVSLVSNLPIIAARLKIIIIIVASLGVKVAVKITKATTL
jgi:hypothetical protein